ncbi:MAG: hypothetical protein KDJ70_15155 [Candidatus Competibacteraceae bacterium]|nr:hypothetical protein [Candidatus Competibacteraceae bacterium]
MKHTIPGHRRHDISDETWALLEPHLPGREGVWGGIAKDHRLFINAVSGYCERARRGETDHRMTVVEATPTVVAFAGAIRGFGKNGGIS